MPSRFVERLNRSLSHYHVAYRAEVSLSRPRSRSRKAPHGKTRSPSDEANGGSFVDVKLTVYATTCCLFPTLYRTGDCCARRSPRRRPTSGSLCVCDHHTVRAASHRSDSCPPLKKFGCVVMDKGCDHEWKHGHGEKLWSRKSCLYALATSKLLSSR